jgi:hypothetical protein
MVPMSELDFFRGHSIRQCWTTERTTIFGCVDEGVFVCGDNMFAKYASGYTRIIKEANGVSEIHLPTSLDGFGEKGHRLRGISSGRGIMLWITSAGVVLWGTQREPLPRLSSFAVRDAVVMPLFVQNEGEAVMCILRDGQLLHYKASSLVDHSSHDALSPVPGISEMGTVLGFASCQARALVWTADASYLVHLKKEEHGVMMNVSPLMGVERAVEICINDQGIIMVNDDESVQYVLFDANSSKESKTRGMTRCELPVRERYRLSLGGNFTSLLYWRKELHHCKRVCIECTCVYLLTLFEIVCGKSTSDCVFYLLLCWTCGREPFSKLPRDVLYYVFSYLPMF